MFFDIFSIKAPELNPDTVSAWLKVVALLKVNYLDLCPKLADWRLCIKVVISLQRFLGSVTRHGRCVCISEENTRYNLHDKNLFIYLFIFLQLSEDEVYVITIRNIVQNYIKQQKANMSRNVAQGDTSTDKTRCNWDSSALTSMFDTVKHLLVQVSKFEKAVTCANWTATKLPKGTFYFNFRKSNFCVYVQQTLCKSLKKES